MTRLPLGHYTREFREQAVKLITEKHLGVKEAAEQLALPTTTLAYWLKQHKAGKLAQVGQMQRPLTEVEVENARLKKELATAKMENEILKKAAAYFARESLPGTH
jgi:transposase